MSEEFPKGVLTGGQVKQLFNFAKKKSFALPAVNVVGSNSVNSVMETAADLNSPVIIQFSNGGSQFMAGKGMSNENQRSAIAGGISGAKHVHELAKFYGATVNFTQTTVQKNYYPGLMVYWMLEKSFLNKMGNLFLVPI